MFLRVLVGCLFKYIDTYIYIFKSGYFKVTKIALVMLG